MSQKVITARGRFHALSAGSHGAPVVVCLHGFPDVAHSMTAIVDSLGAAGFHAVAPFMRGYAPSVLEGPYDIDSLAADVVALADAMSPDAPVALVGHDWGAIAAYAALTLAPSRFTKAVTMAVPHPMAFIANLPRKPRQLARSWYMFALQPALGDWLFQRRDYAFVDRLWRDWSPGFTPDPRHISRIKACFAESGTAPIEYYRSMLRPPAERLARISRARGERISTPVLQLHGGRDGCIGASLAHGQERWFAGPMTREVFPDLGHFLHIEAPLRVSPRIVEYLSA